mmetsp:Transcript_50931/g.91023  ORF Transcript_50931/g.91023 Transcript_50931/m.91023 type:complete len:245 (-) Transcript_50931:137-871(-)
MVTHQMFLPKNAGFRITALANVGPLRYISFSMWVLAASKSSGERPSTSGNCSQTCGRSSAVRPIKLMRLSTVGAISSWVGTTFFLFLAFQYARLWGVHPKLSFRHLLACSGEMPQVSCTYFNVLSQVPLSASSSLSGYKSSAASTASMVNSGDVSAGFELRQRSKAVMENSPASHDRPRKATEWNVEKLVTCAGTLRMSTWREGRAAMGLAFRGPTRWAGAVAVCGRVRAIDGTTGLADLTAGA